MFEVILDKIKEILARFITPEMIDKILGYLQKVQEIIDKIVGYLIQVKEWLFEVVNKFYGG